MIDKDTLEAAGKLGVGLVAVLGLLYLFSKSLDNQARQLDIQERQTDAIEEFLGYYTGKIRAQ